MRGRYLIEVIDLDSDTHPADYVNNGGDQYVGEKGFCVRSNARQFLSLAEAEQFIRENLDSDRLFFAIQQTDIHQE